MYPPTEVSNYCESATNNDKYYLLLLLLPSTSPAYPFLGLSFYSLAIMKISGGR